MSRTFVLLMTERWMNTMRSEEFVRQGTWMHGNEVISKMWMHVPSGVVYYEDVPDARDKKLPTLNRETIDGIERTTTAGESAPVYPTLGNYKDPKGPIGS